MGDRKAGARTSKAGRRARRIKVAKGLLAGKTPGRIAAEEGLSRGLAYKDAASPECQLLIARALDRRAARIDGLLDRCLDAIAGALEAQTCQLAVTETTKTEGSEKRRYESIVVGVDHYARLAGIARLLNLCLAGRPIPRPEEKPPEDRPITYEQFKRLVESYQRDKGTTK